MNNNSVVNYNKEYSDKGLMNKITKCGKKMGLKLVYMCAIMYHTLKSPVVPMKIKTIIVGALGYVIAPIDLIFDGIPVAGFSDDIATVAAAFGMLFCYVTPEIKQKAKETVASIFGESAMMELEAIEVEINDEYK